jgi:hypothetical protein
MEATSMFIYWVLFAVLVFILGAGMPALRLQLRRWGWRHSKILTTVLFLGVASILFLVIVEWLPWQFVHWIS